MRFSVCILVHEWHEKLPDILGVYASCANEILLGINGDFQAEQYPVLRSLPKVRLIPLLWQGYGTTRNQLSARAENDWVLHTDLDEMPDANLQEALKKWQASSEQQVFALQMQHYLGNVPIRYGAWGKGKKWFLRMYHRRFTTWSNEVVHESLLQPRESEVVRLKGKVRHFTAIDEAALLRKSRHYAKLHQDKVLETGSRLPRWKRVFSPPFTFIKQYIFQLGFLDGTAGFRIARANALYTYWKYK